MGFEIYSDDKQKEFKVETKHRLGSDGFETLRTTPNARLRFNSTNYKKLRLGGTDYSRIRFREKDYILPLLKTLIVDESTIIDIDDDNGELDIGAFEVMSTSVCRGTQFQSSCDAVNGLTTLIEGENVVYDNLDGFNVLYNRNKESLGVGHISTSSTSDFDCIKSQNCNTFTSGLGWKELTEIFDNTEQFDLVSFRCEFKNLFSTPNNTRVEIKLSYEVIYEEF